MTSDLIARARAAGLLIIDQHVERRLKVQRSTSASAIDRWRQCQRQWFAGYVEGIWTPQTPAQARGTAIDLEVQRHYKGEPLEHQGWAEAVRGIVRLLPPSPVIQLKIELATYPGGPLLIGYPDFLYHDEASGAATVLDLKSTSDWRYAKTAEQLLGNTQMVAYSAWLWSLKEVDEVRAGHVTAKFKRDEAHPVGYKFQGARRSDLADMEHAPTQAEWSMMRAEVREMVAAAIEVADFHALPATGASDVDEYGQNACERFQGCPHRHRCGLEALGGPKKMSNGAMTLSERLQAMQQQKAGATAPALPAGASPSPLAVTQEQPPTAAGYNPPANPQTVGAAIINPNHAHPGDVLPKDAGYKPGQPCNGKGHYASANGQGFIAVEPGHRCAVCVPAMVVPPDAPPRESTPAEVTAAAEKKTRGRPKKAVMDPEKLIEAFGKCAELGFTTTEISTMQRRGELDDALAGKITPGMLRQPKPPVGYQAAAAPLPEEPPAADMLPGEISKTDPGDGTHAVAPAAESQAQESWYANSGPAAQVTNEQQPENETARISAANPPISTSVARPAAHDSRAAAQAQINDAVAAHRRGPAKAPPVPPVLFVDCFASKGGFLPGAPGCSTLLSMAGVGAVDLADWLAPVAELAALAYVDEKGNPAPLEHWGLAPYAKGKFLLAAAVRECLPSLPAVILVDSSLPGADVFLEQVKPHAALVVEPRGSRR